MPNSTLSLLRTTFGRGLDASDRCQGRPSLASSMFATTRLALFSREVGLNYTLFYVICFTLTSSLAYGQEEQPIVVIASGSGTSAVIAEKAALHAAVEKGVGAYLDVEAILESDQLRETIRSVSRGFVERYEVVVPARLT